MSWVQFFQGYKVSDPYLYPWQPLPVTPAGYKTPANPKENLESGAELYGSMLEMGVQSSWCIKLQLLDVQVRYSMTLYRTYPTSKFLHILQFFSVDFFPRPL